MDLYNFIYNSNKMSTHGPKVKYNWVYVVHFVDTVQFLFNQLVCEPLIIIKDYVNLITNRVKNVRHNNNQTPYHFGKLSVMETPTRNVTF